MLLNRYCGVTGRVLDFGSNGPSGRFGPVIVLCVWSIPLTLTVLLPTKEFKWIPENFQESQIKLRGGGRVGGVTLDELVSHSERTAALIFGSCQRN